MSQIVGAVDDGGEPVRRRCLPARAARDQDTINGCVRHRQPFHPRPHPCQAGIPSSQLHPLDGTVEPLRTPWGLCVCSQSDEGSLVDTARHPAGGSLRSHCGGFSLRLARKDHEMIDRLATIAKQAADAVGSVAGIRAGTEDPVTTRDHWPRTSRFGITANGLPRRRRSSPTKNRREPRASAVSRGTSSAPTTDTWHRDDRPGGRATVDTDRDDAAPVAQYSAGDGSGSSASTCRRSGRWTPCRRLRTNGLTWYRCRRRRSPCFVSAATAVRRRSTRRRTTYENCCTTMK